MPEGKGRLLQEQVGRVTLAGDGRGWGPVCLASLSNVDELRPRGDLWSLFIAFLIREKSRVKT